MFVQINNKRIKNGSIGIARKVFGDSAVRQIIGSGLAFNPIRVNIL